MYCIKEPDPFRGGETVLLKNSDLTAMLDPKVTQEMEEKKIRYQAFLPNKDSKAKLQKSWQDRFWMDDPKVCLFCICSFFYIQSLFLQWLWNIITAKKEFWILGL